VSDSRYAIPVDELVASARVEAGDQVEELAQPALAPADWSTGIHPYGDGIGTDTDGD
jgi:hypothetical protein